MATTSTSSTGTINFGGLASGLDTNTIVTQLVQIERIPYTQTETKISTVAAATQTVTDISTKLSALKTAAAALATPTGFSSFSANSSDSSIVATVTGAAASGSFDFQVNKLAKEQRTYSDPRSSSTNSLSMAGSLSLQIGSGTAANIPITSSDSLTDIASKINQAGLRVNAAVIYDGANYKLQVRGLDTGAANSITFGETGFNLGLSNSSNTKQTAGDSEISLDGQTITRPTNQVVGVLPGVTLALTKVTTSPTTVNVAPDSTSLGTKISALVTAYNNVVSATHLAAGYGSISASNSELSGDSSLRSTLDQLSASIAGNVTGTSGLYTTLASIGLTKTRDGALALDQDKLDAAMEASASSVAALFVNDPQNGLTGAMTGLMSSVDHLATGSTSVLGSRIASLGSETKSLTDQADQLDRRATQYETTLRAQFTALEVQMSQINSNGNALLAALGANTTSNSSSNK